MQLIINKCAFFWIYPPLRIYTLAISKFTNTRSFENTKIYETLFNMSTTQLNSLRPYLKEEDKRACAQFCIFHVTPYMTHYLMNHMYNIMHIDQKQLCIIKQEVKCTIHFFIKTKKLIKNTTVFRIKCIKLPRVLINA